MADTSVGVFFARSQYVDLLWRQCDEPFGRHAGFEIRGTDPTADRLLMFGHPVPLGGRPRAPLPVRAVPGRRGRLMQKRWRLEACYRRLGLRGQPSTLLFYEPPPHISDLEYDIAFEQNGAVFGPDPRAGETCVLPAYWIVEPDLQTLRRAEPVEPEVPLVCVTSGKSYLPGHRERLAFLERLRRADIPLDLFGHGLSPALGGLGPVKDKWFALRGARYTLAIENHPHGPYYVTEKIWDPLLAWSVPIYYGGTAIDTMIPEDAFIRLPDLGDAGIEAVREALAKPELWREKLDAMAEARRRILGELRLVEWIRTRIVEREM